jgi:hypothetical protein
MALSTGGGGGTTIAKQGTSVNDMYTVPSGKTFTGHIWNNSSGGYGYVNGTRLLWPYSSSYFAHSPLEVTLNSGDVFKADNSGTTFILGVER